VTGHALDIGDAGTFELALQFVGKEEVRQLTLAVGLPLAVGVLVVQVVEVDLPGGVGAAGLGHDTRLAVGSGEQR